MINGHWVVDPVAKTGKFWVQDGQAPPELRHEFQVHNATVADGFGQDGHCPPGEYTLGRPIRSTKPYGSNPSDVPYGWVFIPTAGGHGNDGDVRAVQGGIGQHGGGTGLPDPFAPRQGWQITEGCNRLQNEDVWQLAEAVDYILDRGGAVRWTQV